MRTTNLKQKIASIEKNALWDILEQKAGDAATFKATSIADYID